MVETRLCRGFVGVELQGGEKRAIHWSWNGGWEYSGAGLAGTVHLAVLSGKVLSTMQQVHVMLSGGELEHVSSGRNDEVWRLLVRWCWWRSNVFDILLHVGTSRE
jgi:hypothetical protein